MQRLFCCKLLSIWLLIEFLLCKAIAVLDPFSFYILSRVIYALYKVFLHIAYTSLIFRFTGLCSLRWHLIHSTLIDNRLNLLYIHLLFIHTTASLMNALCYVTPYLYYSALISLNLSLSYVSVPSS